MNIILDLTEMWNRAAEDVAIGIVHVEWMGRSAEIGRVVRYGNREDPNNPPMWQASCVTKVTLSPTEYESAEEAAKQVVDHWVASLGIKVTKYPDCSRPQGAALKINYR